MAYKFYELDIDAVLPDNVNPTFGVGFGDYLAWQVGRSETRKKALWLIEPVRELETPISEVLSGDYSIGELADDVTRYGYTRTALPTLSINKLIESFTAELDSIKAAIASE